MKIFKITNRYLISLFFIGVILVFWHFKILPLYSISLKLNDSNYSLNTKNPHKDIVFVAVDEKSVNLNGRWPWDREVLAKGLEKLEYAKVIILDMVFSEKTIKLKDEFLASTLEELDNTICGFFLRNDATQTLDQDSIDTLSESSLERIFTKTIPFVETSYAEINIPSILDSCVLNATFSTLPDEDGLYRRYPVGVLFDSLVYPSLGIQTLRYLTNKDIEIHEKDNDYYINFDNKKINIDNQGFLLLNYYPIENYNLVSFADVQTGKVPSSYFKDKLVLVGITEAGVSDIRATPLGQIPGPLLHYTFLSNYLQDMLLEKSHFIDLFFILLMGLVAVLSSKFYQNISTRAIIYFIVVTIFFFISKLLFIKLNIWVDIFYPIFTIIVLAIVNEIVLFKTKEEESTFIKSAFSNYLSPSLINQIIKDPSLLKLGGQKKNISVLFTDIRSFTTLSEKVTPEELIKILNIYFTPMTNIVFENSGTLDKYIGDAIMAFFNAPLSLENHADYAVKTALSMQIELININKKLSSSNLPSLNFGAGINTSDMIVGNMGSEVRFDYSVIGDGVNLASRIEGLTKDYACTIIISEYTKGALVEDYLIRELDFVKVKGKDIPVTIYEVMQNSSRNKEIKLCYENALQLFRNSKKEEALQEFLLCYNKYKDITSQKFIDINF